MGYATADLISVGKSAIRAELPFEVGEGLDNRRCLEGSVAAAHGELSQDTGAR